MSERTLKLGRLALKFGLCAYDGETATEAFYRLVRNEVLEESAKICDARAVKYGKDDESENEAELCGALIRSQKKD